MAHQVRIPKNMASKDVKEIISPIIAIYLFTILSIICIVIMALIRIYAPSYMLYFIIVVSLIFIIITLAFIMKRDTKDFISDEIKLKIKENESIHHHRNYVRYWSYPLSQTEVCITDSTLLIAEQYKKGLYTGILTHSATYPDTLFIDEIPLHNIDNVEQGYDFLPGALLKFTFYKMLIFTIISCVVLFLLSTFFDDSIIFIVLIIFVLFMFVVFYAMYSFLGQSAEVILNVKNKSEPVKICIYGLKRREEADILIKHLQRSKPANV